MKASESTDFVDNTYVTNRQQARAAGLYVGAYHFARPDASKGDALDEARWFVSHADPGPGNLLPVLDLRFTQKGKPLLASDHFSDHNIVDGSTIQCFLRAPRLRRRMLLRR